VIHKGIENCQDMPAILDDALKHSPQLWLARRLFVPFRQNRSRNPDILPQLLSRMAAQKQPIEKSRLALREFKVAKRLVRRGRQRVGLSRHIKKSAVYGFLRLRQEYLKQK